MYIYTHMHVSNIHSPSPANFPRLAQPLVKINFLTGECPPSKVTPKRVSPWKVLPGKRLVEESAVMLTSGGYTNKATLWEVLLSNPATETVLRPLMCCSESSSSHAPSSQEG